MTQDQNRFKALLEEGHTFPSEFHFKFIVRQEQLDELTEILNTPNIQTRPSKKNSYVSVSAKIRLDSSDDVISVYEKVSSVKGLIAL